MELTFSPASPADSAAIFGFARELIEIYEDPAAIDFPAVLQWMRRKIDAHISQYTYVYFCGEKAGYFRFCPCAGGMELDDLYVFPQFRNQGIGTAVIRRCISQTDTPIELYVFTQNTGALRLYRRLGFEIIQQVSPTRCILRREAL